MDINYLTKNELLFMVNDLAQENAYLKMKSKNSDSAINFGDYILDWLEKGKYKWQEITYQGYSRVIKNHVAPYFKEKNISLQQMKPSDIEAYYYFKMSQGLSGNTVRHHHANIRMCLKSAEKDELIPKNPVALVDLPPFEKSDIHYYSKDKLLELLKISRPTILYPVILFATLGLRRSEALGMMWRNINFDNNTINICEKIIPLKGNPASIEPMLKNKSSLRVLKVPDFVINELKYIYNRQCTEIQQNSAVYSSAYLDYVCVNTRGGIIKPHYDSEFFLKKIIRKNGLTHITLKGLRHTCATLISDMGFNLKYIKEWLGHSTITLTANTYAHIGIEQKSKVAIALQDNIFN